MQGKKILEVLNSDSYYYSPAFAALEHQSDPKVTFLDDFVPQVITRGPTGVAPAEVRKAMIRLFRRLHDDGFGAFKPGRRGKRTRFVWSAPLPQVVADALTAQPGVPSVSSVVHQFVLRPGVTVKVELPADLTRSEAARFARFVEALSFEGATERD